MEIADLDTNIPFVHSIKEWLTVCDSQHTETCAPHCGTTAVSAKQSARPSWLIDVQEGCIAPGDVRAEYLALSYTWQDNTTDANDTEQLQLHSENVNFLSHSGALKQHLAKLPKVIRDAMALTTALGERYLWVDRLCIIQNGPQKKTEIDLMDQVYRGAYATIVGAASCGLYEKPEETMSDTVFKNPLWGFWLHISKDNAELATRCIASNYKRLSRSRWAKRAWTYQEHILSRRVIFFLDEWIFWQCECAVWDLEDLQPEQDLEVTITVPAMSTLLEPLPTSTLSRFSLYADLICPYNGRELSYQEDGLSACTGILNHLSRVFPDGFLFGLPQRYLDYALLWQPLHGTAGSSTRRSTLPSWTWCGWQCFVDPRSLDSALDAGKPGGFRLQKIVEWDCPSPIQGPSMLDRQMARSDIQPIAANSSQWTRRDEVANCVSPNHISARVAVAWFLSAATLEIRNQPYPRFESGFLNRYANPVLTEKPLTIMPKVVVLRDRTSRYSGLLRLTGGITCKRGEAMELVAISKGSTTGKEVAGWFEEKVFQRSIYRHHRPFHATYDRNEWWIDSSDGLSMYDDHNYRVAAIEQHDKLLEVPIDGYEESQDIEFYNVLWIQRGDDNVAYRAGCGRVFRQCWEDNKPEETRITLG